MNPALLLLVASTLTAPQPAVRDLAPSPAFTVGQNVTFVTDDAAADLDQTRPPGSPASPTHQVAGKTVMVMVHGGLVALYSRAGFDIGAGVGFMPLKDNDKLEVDGDFDFGRVSGANGFTISILGQYDIHLSSTKMVPFVGGGLGIGHAAGFTNTGLEIVGGAQFALASGRAIRVEARFLFAGHTTTTFILAGIAF